MIRYGIVGIGGFAGSWRTSLKELEDRGIAKLAAAVVRNPAKYAEQLPKLENSGCTIYSTLDEMLDRGRGQIDVVGVPTGTSYHAPMAIQAMSAGYNVLIEKPAAATIQDVLQLRETEQRTGRWCAVSYQWIYSPTIQWLKQKLDDGALGAIQEMRSMIGWPRPASYYARNKWAGQISYDKRWVLDGPATNATAHYLTNMLYLAGMRGDHPTSISEVRGELYRAKPIPSYDTSCIQVRTSQGPVPGTDGILITHYVSHSLIDLFDPIMDIFCEQGTIHWEAHSDTAVVHYKSGAQETFVNPDQSDNNLCPFQQIARVLEGKDPAPLCGLVEGGPHVLAINLAFESSEGIIAVPEEYSYRSENEQGSEIVGIKGMEELLKKAQASGLMFSELAVPWGQATAQVSAAGYNHFPQSELLKAKLGRIAG